MAILPLAMLGQGEHKSTVTYIDLVPKIKPYTVPSFDTEVLIPLRKAQAAQEAAQATLQTQVVTYTAPAIQWPTLAPNAAKLFIYVHESGNNPTQWNTSGCVGLGQACPASKLLAVCPNLDYACEDNWFTNYAISRYGGWQQAYNHWLQYSNW